MIICHVIFDNIKIINNTGLTNGGGMYFKTSTVQIHNTEGINNTADDIGSFGSSQ